MASSYDFAQFLLAWPSYTALADDLGLKYTAVHAWGTRNRIPVRYFHALAEAAQKRGYLEVNFASLQATERVRIAADDAKKIAKRQLKHQKWKTQNA